jgi:hypothetical protein
LQLCEIRMTLKCPVFDACSFAARSGAMFFLARKFERSELWFCDDAISISVAGVPLMKN